MSEHKLVPQNIVDELAQFIRQVDGNNKMGAGSLADKICERFRVDAPAVQVEPVGVTTPLRAFDEFTTVIFEASKVPVGTKLYASPQVAEQIECGCCGKTVRCDDDCDAVVIGGHKPALSAPEGDA